MRQYALLTLWVVLFGLAIWAFFSVKCNVEEAKAVTNNPIEMQLMLK